MGWLRRLMLSMLLLLVGAGVLPFLLPLKDGQPLLDWPTVTLPALPSLDLEPLKEKVADLASLSDGGETVTLYKWRDAHGQWHFGSTPPIGVPFEKTTVNTNANVVPALSMPSAAPKAVETEPKASGHIAKLMEAARGSQGVLESRKGEPNALIDAQR